LWDSIFPKFTDMADEAVLVNGIPGSGKTTLVTGVTRVMPVPVIAKDALKEALADAAPGAANGRLGRIAAELMWTLAAATPGTVLLDSWWFAPRDGAAVVADLARCGVSTVVEVWCEVPVAVARERYLARARHPTHGDPGRLPDAWPEWVAGARPLGIGTTLTVRTDRPVDHAALVHEIQATFRGPHGAATRRP
jgi:predicted kinase